MEYTPEIQLVLSSLNKDKKELLDKINEIDKVIKKIKYGNFNLGLPKGNNQIEGNNLLNDIDEMQAPKVFPIKADLKVQVIKIFDMIGVACKMIDVRDKYKEITGININIRETLRNLNRHGILKLIQPKGNMRAIYWVKADWLEENEKKLKEEHKFDGFDLLYTDEMIEFK